MYRGNIPGYHWDTDRRKYFRIAPNSAGGHLTAENLARLRKEEEKSRTQAKQAKNIKEQLVQRNPLLSAPLAGGAFLSREIGQYSSQPGISESRIQAQGSGLSVSWASPFDQQVSALAYDPATEDFLVGSRCESGHSNIIAFSRSKGREPHIIQAFGSAEISSISLSPSRIAAVTGTGGSKAMLAFMSLADPAMGPSDGSIGCDLSIQFMFPSDATAWASAANPFLHDQSMFVVGVSDGAIQFTDAEGSWEDMESQITHSDVMAVEWLTPTLVALGQRNGGVKLWDVRSTGTAMRLRHPSRITGMKRVTDHSLAICGLESALAMYDLRMPMEAETVPPAAKRRQNNSRRPSSKNLTQPVLRFDHQNESNRPLGMDIDSNSSLIAAGNDSSGIDMFSLATGKSIKTPKYVQAQGDRLQSLSLYPDTTLEEERRTEFLIRHLQFCQHSKAGNFETSIVCSNLNGLVGLGWQDNLDRDI